MLSDHAELAVPEQAQREAARGPGRGADRGSSVDPNTAAPIDCGTFLAASTESLFSRPACSIVLSLGLPLIPLQERDWLRHCGKDDTAGLNARGRARLLLSSGRETDVA